jgi:hypothetical protein
MLSDCSEQGDMTERTPIVNSVHKFIDNLQRRRDPVNLFTCIEGECSEQGDMTERTTILNSVHTSNDSLH